MEKGSWWSSLLMTISNQQSWFSNFFDCNLRVNDKERSLYIYFVFQQSKSVQASLSSHVEFSIWLTRISYRRCHPMFMEVCSRKSIFLAV